MKKSKHELFLEYKIKSTIIKNGWFILYSILFPIFFALMFKIPWILFACLIMFYPIYLMVIDIKRYKKEIKETREIIEASKSTENAESEKENKTESTSEKNI